MGEVVALMRFSQQEERPQEKQVADVDNGFSRIANELLEALTKAPLTLRQYKVMLAIIRKTYGFNKAMDWVSNSQLEELTGVHETHCSKTKVELVGMGLLVQKGRKVGPNKQLSEWSFSQDSKCLAKTAKKCLAKSANSTKPNQLNTKDKHTKDKKEILCHDSAESDAAAPKPKFSEDDLKTAQWMAGRVEQVHQLNNIPGKFKKPDLANWAITIGRMVRIDELSHTQICRLFDWCSRDNFESTNVRSPDKLRKRWGELFLKSQQASTPSQGSASQQLQQAQQRAAAMGMTLDAIDMEQEF